MQEAGIRVALRGRREAAAELAATERDLDKVGSSVEKSGRKASIASRAWSKTRGVLGAVGSSLGRIVKGGVLGAIATGAGIVGVALHKGFNRLTGIENATAKLDGLGHSSKSVTKIMDNALASVRGTAFGMDEAASTAAGAVAAGIKPGRELERTLKLVADSATIGGSSMGEMGAIWNKVATSNKIQGDVINQLSDQGIPIVQLLAKELGVTGEEVMMLSRKGEIGFDTFRNAMERGMGGAALDSGKTTTGVLKNVNAALGRLGAGMLSGAFPIIKLLGTEAIVVIDGLTTRLGPLIEKMNGSLGPKAADKITGGGERILAYIDRLSASIGGMVADYRAGGLKAVFDGLKFPGGGKSSEALGKIGAAFGDIGAGVDKVDWEAVKTNLGSSTADTVSVFGVVVGFAADHVDTLAKYLPQLVTAVVAYKVAQAAANVAALASVPVQVVQIASQIAHTNALRANTAATVTSVGVERTSRVGRIAHTAATIASSVATKAAAVATRGLNLVMAMNPIGLVVAAVVLLIAGFVLLYKRSDTFRGMVDKLWAGMKVLGGWIKTAFLTYIGLLGAAYLRMGRYGIRAFRWLVTAAFRAFDGILSAAEKGLGWVPGLGKKIKTARAAFTRFGDATVRKLTGVENKLKDAEAAARGLAKDRSFTITANIRTTGKALPEDAGYNGLKGRREFGGPVQAGQAYLVGERRAELFVPKVDGRIMPRVPDLTHLDDVDVSVGPVRPGGPTVIRIELDGRVLAEATLEEFADMEDRG